ncbi:MAG TPA: CoA-transferase, partial [Candidatus Methylomirabilis sp.]|nr:CoA-transferase [Candidatus Methylomirabilis sp.]
MSGKVVSARAAVDLVKSGDSLAIHGAGGGNVEPDLLIGTLAQRFEETGQPRDLTIFHVSGLGDWKSTGLNLLTGEGLVRRNVGGHYGMSPKYAQLILDNKIEAYCWPQGVMSQWLREVAAGRPGLITHIGLKTFIDPRVEGGRLNTRTIEDLVEVITLAGREWLFYRAFPLNVCFIRGTTADEKGNLSLEQEPAILEVLPMAMATRNSGGIVIAQVKRLAQAGTLPPRTVKVPHTMVDYIVVHPGQWQSVESEYNPAYSGEVKVPVSSLPPMDLDERKVIARRAVMEIVRLPRAVLNMGVGMPDGIARVVAEEGIDDRMTATIEQGITGGIPAPGVVFGMSSNPEAIIDQGYQFDFYDGGGLDLTFLGLAEADARGNVNVSKFQGRMPGVGGFVNISQGAKEVVFCGTFTAGGLSVEVGEGRLRIVKEGRFRKFVERVEQITFSGELAAERGQRVQFITERAVLLITKDGLMVTEMAPGVDLARDVLGQMAFRPMVSPDLKTMDARIFR